MFQFGFNIEGKFNWIATLAFEHSIVDLLIQNFVDSQKV